VSGEDGAFAVDDGDFGPARQFVDRPGGSPGQAQPTVESHIFGPHLEDLAREWTLVHTAADTLAGAPPASWVRPTCAP
jgi:hypothetical protein